jgi:PAS domain S-box-containing protein
MIELSSILKSLDDIVLLIDSKLIFRKYWVKEEGLLWISPEEFIGKTIGDVFSDELGVDVSSKVRAEFKTQTNSQIVYSLLGKKGKRWYRVRMNLIGDKDEQGEQYMLLIIGDCTQEVDLKSQNHIFEGVISQNWDAIKFLNLDGSVQYVNPAANRLYGYEGNELIGEHVSIFNNQEVHTTDAISEIVQKKGFWSGELIQVKKDGSLFDAFLSVQLIKDSSGVPTGYVSHSKDITNEKETSNKLKAIIKERETLLKEIHHRVKNNLQVITSLLSLQANTINEEATKVIFQQSQYRINAMAMIHETLYQSEDFLTIGYAQYMEALVHYLVLSMKGSEHHIDWSIDAGNIKLNIDTAIPLGLLINEIITNALKYGFKGDEKGKIYIKIHSLSYPNYVLSIGDDGIGFSSAINFKTTNSLGLKLIHNLARQLRGSIERDLSQKGTHYKMNFQEVF